MVIEANFLSNIIIICKLNKYLHLQFMNIKKHIPNAITCCNLLCGCLAIVQAFEGNLVYAAYLVGLAAVFDFFDGFAARMLKVSSAIGKDLDSLADMVTFGVVPGVVMFQLIQLSMKNYHEFSQTVELIETLQPPALPQKLPYQLSYPNPYQ